MIDWRNVRRIVVLLTLICGAFFSVSAQVYSNIARYSHIGTSAHGIKIKTNIPFEVSADMPTIHISGYIYGQSAPINLYVTFYIWHNDSGVYFYYPVVSSAGGYTPNVKLANENNKVVLYIDACDYYPHIFVNAFSGLNKPASYYENWTIADEPLTGTHVADVAYKNAFSGNVFMSQGIWDNAGNVGIGTITPRERLSVNGNIRAREIKVETANWPDYVFRPEYDLKPLSEVSKFIKENGHLPEVPKASEVESEGVSLGEMNKILLKKVEELTLHLIEKEERLLGQDQRLAELESEVQNFIKRIKFIETALDKK